MTMTIASTALCSTEYDNYNSFMGHFTQIKASGNETICRCPACGKDKLYISVGEVRSEPGTHQMLLNCFHNCKYENILQNASLEPKDLYLTRTQRRRTKDMCAVTRQHVYTDRNGSPLFRKTIYKFTSYWEYNGKKCFPDDKDVFWEKYEAGQYINGGSCNVLYHLDKLKGDTVYIPEGEKDVATLESMGFISTSSGGGAKTTAKEWRDKHYIEQLTGIKTAYILADNDEIGMTYADKVAEYLTKGGIECKVIRAAAIYPEIKEKGDISDIVDIIGQDKAKEALQKAIEAAEVYAVDDTPIRQEEIKKMHNPYDADGQGRLSIANLKAALKHLDISVRYNKITHSVEYSGSGIKQIDPVGVNAVLPAFLYNTLQYYLKGCNTEKIGSFLNAIAFEQEQGYNPILEAIDSETWDKQDRLTELFDLLYISPSDELSRKLITKWLYQCYCGLHNDISNPFSLDSVLVLVGKQGFGKTRFFEKLALSRKYFGEGISLDPRDKDSRMQSTSFWITELGEIASTMKKEINVLKAFISNSVDKDRPPYGKATISHPRLTSFCGTTNDMQFLIDDTGNRRYLTIRLPDDKKIDVKSEKFRKFNALQLWAQIAYICNEEVKKGIPYTDIFRIDELIEDLEIRNAEFAKPLKGEDEVRDLLNTIKAGNHHFQAFTVTEWKQAHSDVLGKYTTAQIGKCLNRIGYECIRTKINGDTRKIYKLPVKTERTDNYYDNPYL